MKSETYNRPLSKTTLHELRALYADLNRFTNRTVEENLQFYSIGMVLATPKVGVLAMAHPARDLLQEQLSFYRMEARNTHTVRLHREVAADAALALYRDLEYGRR